MRYFQKQLLEVSVEKGVFKSFPNFTGKHLCWSLYLIKLQVFNPAYLLKGESNIGAFLQALQSF